MSCCRDQVSPFVFPPQYVVRDYYTPRVVPVIQPVVTVNRQNIVDIPQLYIQPLSTNVVAPQQITSGFDGFQGSLFGRRFF
ncbi:MAG: spore coat protein D [Desulfitobacteriia bacterium]|jgi:hypothetical protein